MIIQIAKLLQISKTKYQHWKIYKASFLIMLLPSAFSHAQNAGYNNAYQNYYQNQTNGNYYNYQNEGQNNPNYQPSYNYEHPKQADDAPFNMVEHKNVRSSNGNKMGLRSLDALSLKSNVALVIDQDANRVLYEKNTHAVLPIASITKVMTSLVVMDAKLPLDEILTITDEDVDYQKNTSSRLKLGQRLTRQEMLLLALMSSENRAASALGRYYPGGKSAFVAAMNRKAKELGMNDSRFVDSNGLSSHNVSSAYDLGRLVFAAAQNSLIRSFSTSLNYNIVGPNGNILDYKNTNRLVKQGNWEILMQKTGYISEAGKCLVLQAKVMGRSVIIVLLDAAASAGRFNDALRIKAWLEGAISENQLDDNQKNHKIKHS
jgi:serine-type D-Ala-D-Ala endopeptidase (penicillin-binding protein 7)